MDMVEEIMERSAPERKSIFPLFACFAVVLALSAFVLPAAAQDDEEETKPPHDFVMKDTGKFDFVMFSHSNHLEKKENKCNGCHPKLFAPKAGKTAKKKGPLTMDAMVNGEFCGSCHNGKANALDVKDDAQCLKCHSVKRDAP